MQRYYDIQANIWALSPSRVIVMSATHPNLEDIPQFTRFINRVHPSMKIRTIKSNNVPIGANVHNFNGFSYLPYQNATVENYSNIIEKINDNVLLKKLLTLKTVKAIYQIIIDINNMTDENDNYLFDTININEDLQFPNFIRICNNWNQPSIQNLGIDYLRIISMMSPDVIQQFIEMSNNIDNGHIIDHENIMASIDNLNGQTFISCNEPESLMDTNFSTFLNDAIKSTGFRSFELFNSQYKKEEAYKNERIERISKRNDGNLSFIDQAVAISEEQNSSLNITDIHQNFKINSKAPSISTLDFDKILCDDDLKIGLMCGIAVFSRKQHETYKDIVVDLLTKNQLRFVFADSSLNYGNSFPFNNGIITNDFNNLSANSIFQVWGRAGRINKSDYADLYVSSDIIDIVNLSLENDFECREIKNYNDIIDNAKYYYCKYQKDFYQKSYFYKHTINELQSLKV